MKIYFDSDFIGCVDKIVITNTDDGSVMKCYPIGCSNDANVIYINIFNCLYDVVISEN